MRASGAERPVLLSTPLSPLPSFFLFSISLLLPALLLPLLAPAQTTTLITFNPAGGTPGVPATTIATLNAAMPVITGLGTSAPGLAGFAFNGYWDAPTNGVQYYRAVRTGLRPWDKTDPLATLHAQWLRVTTVTFDLNGGAGFQPAPATMTFSQTLPGIGNANPTLTGFAFGGWWDDPAPGQGTAYYNAFRQPLQTWDKDVPFAVLYARWNPNTRTLAFNPNNGLGAPPPDLTAAYLQPLPDLAPYPPLTRPGHAFQGWWTGAADAPLLQLYRPDHTPAVPFWDDITSGGTVQLYAQWSELGPRFTSIRVHSGSLELRVAGCRDTALTYVLFGGAALNPPTFSVVKNACGHVLSHTPVHDEIFGDGITAPSNPCGAYTFTLPLPMASNYFFQLRGMP